MILSKDELRKAQLLMLSILKEVHRVCEENGIHYFLSDGTLIGAVRHNGFIPWDDDIDIGMLREDYEKFCLHAHEILPKNLVIQNEYTDSGYGQCYSKVVLQGTKWLEHDAKKTSRKYSGLYIDIFVYDKIATDKKKQKKQSRIFKFIRFLIYAKQGYWTTYKNRLKQFIFNVCYGLAKIITLFIPAKALLKQRNKIIFKYRDLTEDYTITKFGGSYLKNINPLESFKNLELHQFEDTQFYIPCAYDSILRNLYGDYMKIPDASEIQSHGIEEFDFGEY